jgi:hypothetical protein
VGWWHLAASNQEVRIMTFPTRYQASSNQPDQNQSPNKQQEQQSQQQKEDAARKQAQTEKDKTSAAANPQRA